MELFDHPSYTSLHSAVLCSGPSQWPFLFFIINLSEHLVCLCLVKYLYCQMSIEFFGSTLVALFHPLSSDLILCLGLGWTWKSIPQESNNFKTKEQNSKMLCYLILKIGGQLQEIMNSLHEGYYLYLCQCNKTGMASSLDLFMIVFTQISLLWLTVRHCLTVTLLSITFHVILASSSAYLTSFIQLASGQ